MKRKFEVLRRLEKERRKREEEEAMIVDCSVLGKEIL